MPMTTLREAAAILGKKGGQAKTPRKVATARLNGKKGGRPRKIANPKATA